jgi:hypothetical protein
MVDVKGWYMSGTVFGVFGELGMERGMFDGSELVVFVGIDVRGENVSVTLRTRCLMESRTT